MREGEGGEGWGKEGQKIASRDFSSSLLAGHLLHVCDGTQSGGGKPHHHGGWYGIDNDPVVSRKSLMRWLPTKSWAGH